MPTATRPKGPLGTYPDLVGPISRGNGLDQVSGPSESYSVWPRRVCFVKDACVLGLHESAPAQGRSGFASVVDVDAEEGIGVRQVEHLAPGIVAVLFLYGARIIVDGGHQDLAAIGIAWQGVGVPLMHEDRSMCRALGVEV